MNEFLKGLGLFLAAALTAWTIWAKVNAWRRQREQERQRQDRLEHSKQVHLAANERNKERWKGRFRGDGTS